MYRKEIMENIVWELAWNNVEVNGEMIVDRRTDEPLGPKVVYTYQKGKIEFTFLFFIKQQSARWILLQVFCFS